MKIGIITYSQALNYGAALQMYALQRCINDHIQNVEAEVIDYRSKYLTSFYSVKNQKNKNPIITMIKTVNFLQKRRKFENFEKKNVLFSRTVYDETNKKDIDGKYDVVIVGSDQVWNPNLTKGDLSYFLDFLDLTPRFSYAASVGIDRFPDEFLSDIYNNLLRFIEISTREQSAKKMIDRFVGSDTCRVDVDPTLLLKPEEWISICNKKNIKKRYVLVYTVEFSKEIINEAITFAKEKNLEVLYVGQYSRIKGIRYLVSPTVDVFLSLFKNAEYIFVNSFHGTVFSIQFHKKFYSKLVLKDGRNSRITDLLELCELDERVSINKIEDDIDWDKVDAIIEEKRKISKAYLKRIAQYGTK